MMDMTLLLDQGGTVSSHSVTGAWIVVMPVTVERYAEIARVAIQFCPGAVPAGDAFAVSRGLSRRVRRAENSGRRRGRISGRNAGRFPDGSEGSPRLRTGRRAAAGEGLWDEYRREISVLRNFREHIANLEQIVYGAAHRHCRKRGGHIRCRSRDSRP
jgi:hypothetical protein